MMTHSSLCGLCVTECQDYKNLSYQNGQYTREYQLVNKYFDSKLLNLEDGNLTVLCLLCWRHIFDFHNFQQFVFDAQEKFNAKSCQKEELKIVDSIIDAKEYLPLEAVVANAERQQRNQPYEENITDNVGQSLCLSPKENIEIVSIDDDEDDLPNEENITSKEFLSQDDNLTDCDEVMEILSSDEEFEVETSSSTVVDQAMTPPETDNIISDSINVPNKESWKSTKRALMDADDDEVIAHWKPNLKCRQCSRCYSSFKLLRFHCRQKHPLLEFYIVCCRRRFYYRCKLAEHIRRHMIPYPYECKFCRKSFTRKSNLISHVNVQHPETIEKAPKMDKTEVITVNGNPSLAIEELKEGAKKKSRNLLNEDDAIIAQWKPKLKCEVCEQIFVSFTSLREHFRENHPKHTLHIECCQRKFKYRSELGDHIRRHIDPHPFKCKFCTKRYTQRGNLITHMQDIHDFRSKTTDRKVGGIIEHLKKDLLAPEELQEDEKKTSRSLLNEDDAIIAQWKPRLKCQVCEKIFVSFTSLREHFREDHPKDTLHIECCRRKFKYRCELGDHIRRHIDPHPFKCKFCTKRYTQRGNLITHMQDIHHFRPKRTDKEVDDIIEHLKKKLDCSYCNQTFSSVKLLRHHFRYKHPTKKFHVKCCGLKFSRRSEIVAHIRTHLKISLSIFKCDKCDKLFTNRRGLNKHTCNSHKDNTDNKQFDYNLLRSVDDNKNHTNTIDKLDNAIAQWKTTLKCLVCNKTLSAYSLLQKHYQKEHPYEKCYFVCCGQNLSKHNEIQNHMRLHCVPETFTCPLCDECFISEKDLSSHKQRSHSQISSNENRRMSQRIKSQSFYNFQG